LTPGVSLSVGVGAATPSTGTVSSVGASKLDPASDIDINIDMNIDSTMSSGKPARVLAPPAGELDGGSVASGRQNWHAEHGRLGPAGTSNDFIATDKDVHNNPPLEAALVAKSNAPTSTTRLVVKGVGVKVDGRRSNKKETLSWSRRVQVIMKKRGLGGPDDVGGVLGRACAPPLLFPGDERFRPSDARDSGVGRPPLLSLLFYRTRSSLQAFAFLIYKLNLVTTGIMCVDN
jgi:hypothetical protein